MAQKWIDKIEKNNEEYDIYREGFEIGTNESGNYTLSLSNTPPIYNITDQVPYNFRPSGGDFNIGKKELDELVGGTVAWNQLLQNGNFESTIVWSKNRCDISVANNVGTFTCNSNEYISWGFYQRPHGVINNKCLVCCTVRANATNQPARLALTSSGTDIKDLVGNKTVFSPTNNTWYDLQFIGIVNNTYATVAISEVQNSTENVTIGDILEAKNFVFFDLTKKFGSTIADHVYDLESATAGAGVTWLHKYGFYDRPYYPYNPGELVSVQTSAHKMVGFNQFNISSKTNNSLIVWATGNIGTENMSIVSDYIRIVPRAKYYCNYKAQWCCYDSNYTYLGAISPSGTLVFSAGVETNSVTLPTDYNIVFIRLGIRTVSNGNEDITAKTDINLNLSYNGSNDGKYKPYQKHTYNLPNVELRGIFKLDSNNKLYCDGDIEKSDGTIIRYYAMRSYQSGDESLENAITDGTNTVYKLATPIIEKTNFFTNPQTVYNQGTEEYIDNREVAIPVGHNTKYDEPWEEIKN